MAKTRPTSIETVNTNWTDLVMVCSRCGDSGFGHKGHDSLRASLRQALRDAGLRRQVGIVEVGCFGVCPKHAVTTALASRPDRLMVIPQGEAASVVLQRLGVELNASPGSRDNSENSLARSG